eukprot:TRINITY_DN9136_c0_g1_i1.p2 TRINITY_DN9136_c0_g1~~TRINITY_DN9136_c0_g1_i1.p2  ORF type:complete len:255 (+),score=11.41 TRINITY_DN9136_c0_g1_i1:202-966(+)
MTLVGVIFRCNNNTQEECLQRCLFGAPQSDKATYRHVNTGTKCFLLNINTKMLIGAWDAQGPPRCYQQDAFQGNFPYQVLVKQLFQQHIYLNCDQLVTNGCLGVDKFNKVQLQLTTGQVNSLMFEFRRKWQRLSESQQGQSRRVVIERMDYPPRTQQQQYTQMTRPAAQQQKFNRKRSRSEAFSNHKSFNKQKNEEKRRQLQPQQRQHVIAQQVTEEVRRTEVKHVKIYKREQQPPQRSAQRRQKDSFIPLRMP